MGIAQRTNSAPFPNPSLRARLGANFTNQHSWDEVLHDGQLALIREIRDQDVELERRFFLGTMVSPSDNLRRHLVVLDPARDVALIGDGVDQSEIGVARPRTEGDDFCEFAVTVSDEWQKSGLGTLLMQQFIRSAIERGIKSMHWTDAADNEPNREFATDLEFKCSRAPDDATRVMQSLDLSARSGQKIS